MKRFLTLMVVGLGLIPLSAKADSVVQTSQSGNTSGYTVYVNSPNTYFGGITLSGFENPTSATLTGDLANFFSATIVGSKVELGAITNMTTNSTVLGTLYVDSQNWPYFVNYEIQDINGHFTGSTYDPNVVPTPEPSSLILLGTGLVGVAGVFRRKFKAA